MVQLIVVASAIPWIAIYREIKNNPKFLEKFARHPRKFEEFIAGAYDAEGWDEVILTPRSGDGGRDVIATKRGFGSIRILDQTKAYRPGHLVTHDDIRAMLGVLITDSNSSKGIITTTSDFQPTIKSGPEFQKFLPYRLELKNGKNLVEWLDSISGKIRQDP
jgi:restriction system protein